MLLQYPSISKKPIIYVAVRSGGHTLIIQMLLDTGSDTTCFPAGCAKFLGHDNGNDAVKKKHSEGIGGKTLGFLHTLLDISLFNPQTPILKLKLPPSIIWSSPLGEYFFLDGFDPGFGLIGRDLMRRWKRFSIIPNKSDWIIEIEI